MIDALFWGLVTGGSLLVGAIAVFVFGVSDRLLGAVMAFGAGVLISAVAFELVEDAVEKTPGDWAIAVGLFTGAMSFYIGDRFVDRVGGNARKSTQPQTDDANARAIMLGTVLDGIPESVVIGVSLVKGAGVSVAIVAAVFISNLPESIASTSGLLKSGWSRAHLLIMWGIVVVVSGLASLAGYALLKDAPTESVAFVQAFAAGALLTMLADSMMPKAYSLGGRATGLLTTLGFALAFALSAID